MMRAAIRTIRNGKVKIGRLWWQPKQNHMAYDGRLDGERMVFGLYRDYENGGWSKSVLCLWGSEEYYHNPEKEPIYEPELVDGSYPWYWWEPMEEVLAGEEE